MQKVDVSNLDNTPDPSKGDNYEAEYEELTQKVFKNPTLINSFPSDALESAPPTPNQKRNSIFFKKKSTKDDRHDNIIYEEVKNEKKVLLLKYTKTLPRFNFLIGTIVLHLQEIQKLERIILFFCPSYVYMVIIQPCLMNLRKNHHICHI